MGLKRHLDEEDFQELSFKQPKQLDSGNKLTLFAEDKPSYEGSQKADIPHEVEGIFRKFQFGDGLENHHSVNIVSDLADKEFETSASVSWVTSITSDENAGSRGVFGSSLSPEYFEFNFPRRTLVQFEDTYSYLLNCSPRKEVPLGPTHQADVPVWDPEVIKKHSLSSTYIVDDEYGDKLMGVCVIPMSDSQFSAQNGTAANDRIDCNCVDGGSVRCVQHHVKEARKKLRENLGHDKFVNLGLRDMGEEVAHKWTEEEEGIFHEVVYSNPASLKKNFWEHLSMIFPSRTKKELIRYYFNVFMLRRRAAQNRSRFLEVDSDDDEWQGNNGGPFGVRVEDEDSSVESFSDQDTRVDHEDASPIEYANGDEYDDDEDNDDDGEQVGGADATEKDGGRGHMSKAKIENSLDDGRVDLMLHHLDKFRGNIREDFNVQEDCCTSFEGRPYMTYSYGPVGERASIQESKVNSDSGKCLHENGKGSSDGLGPEFVLEPCDAKLWDASYLMGGPIKGVDLIPTCSMIEEIFGPCARNSKSSNDKSIS